MKMQSKFRMRRVLAITAVPVMSLAFAIGGFASVATDGEDWPAPPPPPASTPAPAPTTPPPTPAPAPPPRPNPSVDVELALLVDSSSSVTDEEYVLQRDGYVNAFQDPAFKALVESSKGVAVNYIDWSSTTQVRGTWWTILRTAEDCDNLARRIASIQRTFRHNTIMANAISLAIDSVQWNGIDSARQVIDVSGDGICENYSKTVLGIKDENDDGTRNYGIAWNDAIKKRPETTVINAISIGDTPGLKEWFADAIPQGPSSFAMHANTFEDFGDAIKKKMLRELEQAITHIESSYD